MKQKGNNRAAHIKTFSLQQLHTRVGLLVEFWPVRMKIKKSHISATTLVKGRLWRSGGQTAAEDTRMEKCVFRVSDESGHKLEKINSLGFSFFWGSKLRKTM